MADYSWEQAGKDYQAQAGPSVPSGAAPAQDPQRVWDSIPKPGDNKPSPLTGVEYWKEVGRNLGPSLLQAGKNWSPQQDQFTKQPDGSYSSMHGPNGRMGDFMDSIHGIMDLFNPETFPDRFAKDPVGSILYPAALIHGANEMVVKPAASALVQKPGVGQIVGGALQVPSGAVAGALGHPWLGAGLAMNGVRNVWNGIKGAAGAAVDAGAPKYWGSLEGPGPPINNPYSNPNAVQGPSLEEILQKPLGPMQPITPPSTVPPSEPLSGQLVPGSQPTPVAPTVPTNRITQPITLEEMLAKRLGPTQPLNPPPSGNGVGDVNRPTAPNTSTPNALPEELVQAAMRQTEVNTPPPTGPAGGDQHPVFGEPRTALNSSALKSAAYHAPTQTQLIEMTNGKVLVHPDLPPELHEGLVNAESKGKFYNENIRPRYQTKVSTMEAKMPSAANPTPQVPMAQMLTDSMDAHVLRTDVLQRAATQHLDAKGMQDLVRKVAAEHNTARALGNNPAGPLNDNVINNVLKGFK